MDDKLFLNERFQKVVIDMLARWDRLANDDMPDKYVLIFHKVYIQRFLGTVCWLLCA